MGREPALATGCRNAAPLPDESLTADHDRIGGPAAARRRQAR
ncbi:hypothetical protein [Actinomyces sp. 2119]|nr:hypothetical protein [Actinomyces sp. 2119]